MIHILVNDSSGAGKSTIARQCIGPYVFLKKHGFGTLKEGQVSEKAVIWEWSEKFETDFGKSSCVDVQRYTPAEGLATFKEQIHKFLNLDEDIIIDASSWIDVSVFLYNYLDNSFKDFIVFHIAVSDYTDSIKCAVHVINDIFKFNPIPKVIIYLNQVGKLEDMAADYRFHVSEPLADFAEKYYSQRGQNVNVRITCVPKCEYFTIKNIKYQTLYDIYLIDKLPSQFLKDTLNSKESQEDGLWFLVFLQRDYLANKSVIFRFYNEYVMTPIEAVEGHRLERVLAKQELAEEARSSALVK